MEVLRAACALMLRSMVVGAQWAGQWRLLCLRQATAAEGEPGEVRAEVMDLRDENRQLKSENSLLKSRLCQASRKRRYSPTQRLQILWHMAYYGIPRSRVKEHFCIARSTLYRWLHAAEKGIVGKRTTTPESPRKTPQEIARLIWEIFESKPHFGRHRTAMTLWALGVFVAASTVRNILLAPKHIITDQEGVFTSQAYRELLERRRVRQRFGAVGKHGSIAVTERAILTLKYEWLRRVPVIRGMDHLADLLDDFDVYYNGYREHMTLGRALPAIIHRGEEWSRPEKSAKTLPANLERLVFPDTGITACRLAA